MGGLIRRGGDIRRLENQDGVGRLCISVRSVYVQIRVVSVYRIYGIDTSSVKSS